MSRPDTSTLPIRTGLAFTSAGSFAIAVLMALALIVGLLRSAIIYPSPDLLRSSLPADAVNLLGSPVLLGSVWSARRGSLVGLLLWPGALLYLLYHDLAYVFSLQLNVLFLLHLALAALNVYALIGLFASIDGTAVRQLLTGAVAERTGGGVLTGLGTLFLLAATRPIVNALLRKTPVAATELALHVTDFLFSPAWIIGGVLLWRRKALGYVTGLGLLFQASMLFVGLIVLLALRPFMIDARLDLKGVLVALAIGLICFVPFGLFARSVAMKQRT